MSLFQITHAYTIFTHDSGLIPTMMYRTNGQPSQGKRMISPEVARQVHQVLETMTVPGGTAPQAQAIGYRVEGRTDTAWKRAGRDCDRSKYCTSLIGLTPMLSPHIIVAVSMNESAMGNRYGDGTVDPASS